MIDLGPAPDADPSPMTVAGTHALTERYYALKRCPPPVAGVSAPHGVVVIIDPAQTPPPNPR